MLPERRSCGISLISQQLWVSSNRTGTWNSLPFRFCGEVSWILIFVFFYIDWFLGSSHGSALCEVWKLFVQ